MTKAALQVAVYKGDDFVISGTVRLVAEKLGVRQRTIRYYLSPAYRRRLTEFKKPTSGKNVINVIRLEDD